MTPFAGGVGCQYQEICGALSGGLAVIGGLYGRENGEQDDERAQSLACRFRQRFLDEFGVTQCDLVRKLLKEPGGMGACANLVAWTAEMLLEVLDDEAGT
jgi:C_GCAxxG_C_C family probable redox protein